MSSYPKSKDRDDLEGNPSKRSKKQPIETEVSMPTAPRHLDADAKAMWKKIGKILLEMGTVTQADWIALSVLCSDWSVYLQTSQTLAEQGYTIKSQSGWLATNPLVAVRDKAIDRVLRISRDFGLSPISRLRLQGTTTKAEETDELLDWGS